MKSLFLRIFLSFWMAQALFVVLAILVTLVFRPRTSTWEALRTTVLNDAVSAYEEGGERQLRHYMEGLEGSQHVRACQTRNRCVATQNRFPDSARVSDAEFRPELERRPDRQPAHRPI